MFEVSPDDVKLGFGLSRSGSVGCPSPTPPMPVRRWGGRSWEPGGDATESKRLKRMMIAGTAALVWLGRAMTFPEEGGTARRGRGGARGGQRGPGLRGVWVFGGGLRSHEAVSVVATDGTVTDGPYPESKAYIGAGTNSRISCAQRQAAAILPAHSSASSREGTSALRPDQGRERGGGRRFAFRLPHHRVDQRPGMFPKDRALR